MEIRLKEFRVAEHTFKSFLKLENVKEWCLTIKGWGEGQLKPIGKLQTKTLNKKTIVEVRGEGGQRGMVKDHTFALFLTANADRRAVSFTLAE